MISITRTLLLTLLICFVVTTRAPGQDESDPPATSADPVPVEEIQGESESNALQQVDGVFKSAVEVMETVLFYRLGTHERAYVTFDNAIPFVRDRGSAEPFVSIDPEVSGVSEIADLTAAEMAAVSPKNFKVIKSSTGDVLRLGKQGDREVEFVLVSSKTSAGKAWQGDKFVLKPESKTYHKVQKRRGLLSDEDVVDEQTVAQWNEAGDLSLPKKPANPDMPFLQYERVGGIPLVVAWLACGAVFFTLYMQGFNIWGFSHALAIVRGKYDNPEETGEVTHFQALASALSATIGLGNIAGVTIAMTLGGPGAFFWMLLCGIFGMCSKFVECTLGQKYRHVKPDGTVLGGPMRYLQAGLAEMKLGFLGSILSIVFAVMCVLASFGGGNMLQANQAGSAMLQMFQQENLNKLSDLNDELKKAESPEEFAQLTEQRSELQSNLASFESRFKVIYGIVLAALVGAVIIGGIKRIGAAASRIVPTMCLVYVAACIYIIATHITQVPAMISLIFTEAFSGEAMGGGIIGVLVVGVQRAAFSNEAGAGSAAIAHSAAKTEEPIREGCVALLGPFIDTVIVCSMTALVILITGAWDNSEWIIEQDLKGAALTSRAFEEEISWFPMVLSLAVTMFAYSTIISWSYYGEKAWEFLLGSHSTPIYKVLAVLCVFIGTIVNLGSVLDFSDMMILGMAFPNIAGVVLLAPKVKKDLWKYWSRYKAGEFPTYK